MKKILIRAGMSPLDNFPDEYAMYHNILGNNIGNSLYAYSVFRALTFDASDDAEEETRLVPTYYKFKYTDEEIEEINSTYSCFVIPLANAFRSNFASHLRGLASLIKKLTIPCIVIGVGINFPYDPDLKQKFEFDKDVKAFMDAVLEKSSIVGVRGEITGKYLSNLGYKEDVDYTVIGCPSMYTFGRDLYVKEGGITRDSLICVNHSTQSPQNIRDFTNNAISELTNYYMLWQTKKEYRFIYTGMSYMYGDKKNFPCKYAQDELYREDRLRFFTNVSTWLDFMRSADFSFGARLHGNIAATIVGTPSLLLVKDARTQELSSYHHLPCATPDRIDASDSLFDLIERVDLKSHLKYQGDNFDRYVDFLNKNNLKHIFINDPNPGNVALDRQMSSIHYNPPIKTIAACTNDEILARMDAFYPQILDELCSLGKKNKELQQEIKNLKAEKKELEKGINKNIINRAINHIKNKHK